MDVIEDTKVSIQMGDGPKIETTTGQMKKIAEDLKGNGMKNTPEDDAVSDKAYRATSGELRSFIERVESINADIKEHQDDRKEVFAEAKARGYDVKVLRRIVALRKMDPNSVAEEEAVLDMYKEALGM